MAHAWYIMKTSVTNLAEIIPLINVRCVLPTISEMEDGGLVGRVSLFGGSLKCMSHNALQRTMGIKNKQLLPQCKHLF